MLEKNYRKFPFYENITLHLTKFHHSCNAKYAKKYLNVPDNSSFMGPVSSSVWLLISLHEHNNGRTDTCFSNNFICTHDKSLNQVCKIDFDLSPN